MRTGAFVGGALARRLLLGGALALSGCGYAPINSAHAARTLHVVRPRSRVADAALTDVVVAGVRDLLNARGVLAAGGGYPAVVVEVSRRDFVAEGVALPSGASKAGARATDIGLTARAFVLDAEGGEPMDDTGDVRAFEVSGIEANALAEGWRERDADARAAHELGESLGRRILHEPAMYDAPIAK